MRVCLACVLGRALLVHANRPAPPSAALQPAAPALGTEGPQGEDEGRVLALENPLDVWRTLRRTGRHGWRRPTPNRKPHPHKTALLLDWLVPVVAISLFLALHVALLHFESSWALHAGGLAAGVAVACFYLAFLHLRHGTEYAVLWVTGYLLEIVNMAENTFVFHSVFRSVRTPPEHARKAMSIVMLIQMLFQTVCYLGLAAILRQLKVLPYIVGVWLIYTGYCVATLREDDLEYDLVDTWLVNCLQGCLGTRFYPSYDERSDVFVIKNNQITMTMLGLVVCLVCILGLALEADVTLTKIEELPAHLALTSSAFASLLLPEFFFLFGELFRSAPTLRYGVGALTAFFGAQMLLGDLLVVPAAVSCAIMLAAVTLCLALAAAHACAGLGAGEGAAGAVPGGPRTPEPARLEAG